MSLSSRNVYKTFVIRCQEFSEIPMKIIKTAAYKEAGRYKKFTDEQVQKMISMYNRGNSMSSISEKFDVNRVTIGNYLRAAKVTPPNKLKNLQIDNDIINKIIELYSDKMGIVFISKHVNVPIMHVKYVLQQAKIATRGSSVSSSFAKSTGCDLANKLMDEDHGIVDIVMEYAKKMTPKQISSKTSIPTDAILHIMRENGVTPSYKTTHKQKINKIIKLFREKNTPHAISKIMHITPQTVQKIIIKNLPQSEKQAYRDKIMHERGSEFIQKVEKIREIYRYNPRIKISVLARILNMPLSTVSRIIDWFINE